MPRGNVFQSTEHLGTLLFHRLAYASVEVVLELQEQLRDKDMKLTDIRLEALSSAHHLESLRDTMNRMKNEILSLKSDNERMQRMINEKGLTCGDIISKDSASSCLPPSGRISLGDPTRFDAIAMEALNRSGQRFTVAVKLGPLCRVVDGEPASVLIGTVAVTNKTSWDTLDSYVRKTFKVCFLIASMNILKYIFRKYLYLLILPFVFQELRLIILQFFIITSKLIVSFLNSKQELTRANLLIQYSLLLNLVSDWNIICIVCQSHSKLQMKEHFALFSTKSNLIYLIYSFFLMDEK